MLPSQLRCPSWTRFGVAKRQKASDLTQLVGEPEPIGRVAGNDSARGGRRSLGRHSATRGHVGHVFDERLGAAFRLDVVFFAVERDVFHTYSAYARGTESLTDSYRLLDMTPYGRQEDFEDSPAGFPQKPTYG